MPSMVDFIDFITRHKRPGFLLPGAPLWSMANRLAKLLVLLAWHANHPQVSQPHGKHASTRPLCSTFDLPQLRQTLLKTMSTIATNEAVSRSKIASNTATWEVDQHLNITCDVEVAPHANEPLPA